MFMPERGRLAGGGHDQSEGVLLEQDICKYDLVPVCVCVCLLVAAGRGGCWLVAVAVVGITPRIFQVDILATVLSSQEFPKKST